MVRRDIISRLGEENKFSFLTKNPISLRREWSRDRAQSVVVVHVLSPQSHLGRGDCGDFV